MKLVLAFAVAALFASGTFLVLARDVVKVVWGLSFLMQGTNLYLLSMGRISGVAPIVEEGVSGYSDPLPQALILTAIVIGFGVTGLAVVLLLKSFEHSGTLDVEEMR